VHGYVCRFRGAIEEEVPWAEIVIDRFHMAQTYRDFAKTVRKKEFKRLQSALPKTEYAEIKGTMWPFRKRPGEPEPPKWERLVQVFTYSPKIEEAYHLREALRELFEHDDTKGGPSARSGLGASGSRGCPDQTYLSECAVPAAGQSPGKKRAVLAMAYSILVIAYYMLQRQEPYREAGADFFDRLQPEDTARRLVKRLEHLGYHVTLQNLPTEVMPQRRRLFSRQAP
jgi:hypothetical protein